MTRYSVQPRDQICLKSYGVLSFAKIMGKNIGKNLLQINLKLLQKEQFKKPLKQLVIGLVIQLLIKSQKSQKLHHRIIQKQSKAK